MPTKYKTVACTRYVMEPGDGTRYDFSICECPSFVEGTHGGGFYTLVIHMASSSGAVDLWNYITMESVGYVLGRMAWCQRYTVIAVLLAFIELMGGGSVEDASAAMLRAPEYMRERS